MDCYFCDDENRQDHKYLACTIWFIVLYVYFYMLFKLTKKAIQQKQFHECVVQQLGLCEDENIQQQIINNVDCSYEELDHCKPKKRTRYKLRSGKMK